MKLLTRKGKNSRTEARSTCIGGKERGWADFISSFTTTVRETLLWSMNQDQTASIDIGPSTSNSH